MRKAEAGSGLAPGAPGSVILKVGTLDDPSIFGEPQMAIFLCDKQSFHHVPGRRRQLRPRAGRLRHARSR